MNDKLTLISTLLSRYYDGTATQAETAKLLRLIESLTDSELTADLRMERDLMRALYDSAPADDSDIPSDLEERLTAATIGSERKPDSTHRRFVWLYRAVAIAASMVLLIGLVWRFTGGHEREAIGDGVLVAQMTEDIDATATFKEVTDSVEAAQVTLVALQTLDRAMAQVGKNLTPAMESINETGRRIDNASQIIKQSFI